jgi:hypothetical protein
MLLYMALLMVVTWLAGLAFRVDTSLIHLFLAAAVLFLIVHFVVGENPAARIPGGGVAGGSHSF